MWRSSSTSEDRRYVVFLFSLYFFIFSSFFKIASASLCLFKASPLNRHNRKFTTVCTERKVIFEVQTFSVHDRPVRANEPYPAPHARYCMSLVIFSVKGMQSTPKVLEQCSQFLFKLYTLTQDIWVLRQMMR